MMRQTTLPIEMISLLRGQPPLPPCHYDTMKKRCLGGRKLYYPSIGDGSRPPRPQSMEDRRPLHIF